MSQYDNQNKQGQEWWSYQTLPPAYSPPEGQQLGQAASAPPPVVSSQPSRTIEQKRQMLDQLASDHDINPSFKDKLWQINETHIILLCDDSGSMNAQVDGQTKTRWDELKKAVTEILDIALIFDPIGMDVHFLNRPQQLGVKFTEQIAQSFRAPPNGGTPLVTKLTTLEQMYRNMEYNKLLIIATDGEPSDDQSPNYTNLRQCVARLIQQGYHIGFLVCTDDDRQVRYINEIDRQYQQVDVTDDYLTELREVRRAQGRNFKFSYGDYIVKLLVGSIDQTMDLLDEHRLLLPNIRHRANGCSIV